MKQIQMRQEYGSWTLIDEPHKRVDSPTAKKYVLCRCKCGTEKEVQCAHLISGKTKSCGCARNRKRKTNQCPGCQQMFYKLLPYNHLQTSKTISVCKRCRNGLRKLKGDYNLAAALVMILDMLHKQF